MLTDTQVQQAQARNKHYKLADQGGLYLYVSPKGGRSWRYDYYLCEKRETVTFGQYPDFSLAEARELHAKARQLVARGESPAQAKQAEKRAAKEAARAAREAQAREKASRREPDKRIAAFAYKRPPELSASEGVTYVTVLTDIFTGALDAFADRVISRLERSSALARAPEEEGR